MNRGRERYDSSYVRARERDTRCTETRQDEGAEYGRNDLHWFQRLRWPHHRETLPISSTMHRFGHHPRDVRALLFAASCCVDSLSLSH